jgi:hypothetical protein
MSSENRVSPQKYSLASSFPSGSELLNSSFNLASSHPHDLSLLTRFVSNSPTRVEVEEEAVTEVEEEPEEAESRMIVLVAKPSSI